MKNWIPTLGAALLLSAAPYAMAVNYPTELRVIVGVSDVEPPDLLLGFHNNEGDSVLFRIELSIDGVPLPPGSTDGWLHCIRSSADPNDCKGAVRENLRDPTTTEKGWRAVVLSPPDKVKFDTEYCFRVRALGNQGRLSAWAPWACAHTPPLPGRPAVQPPLPQLTLIDQGTSGRGQVGSATPGRMLVEWTQNASSVGWYSVERARATPNASWAEIGRVKPGQGSGDLEFLELITDAAKVPGPDNPTLYRVCAGNIGGKTCSVSRSYPPYYLKQAVGQSATASLAPKRPVETSLVKPSAAFRVAVPEIVAPLPGGQVAQGRLRLQVNPSPGSESNAGEVEFSWQAPRGENGARVPAIVVATKVWKTTMAALSKGALVPASEGPGEAGVWTARVRSVRGAGPDPWSEPVSFTYTLTGSVKTGTTAVLPSAAVIGNSSRTVVAASENTTSATALAALVTGQGGQATAMTSAAAHASTLQKTPSSFGAGSRLGTGPAQDKVAPSSFAAQPLSTRR